MAVSSDAWGNQPQPQAPPQQPPPPDGPGEPAWRPEARPPTETVDRSFTVSSWPCGQVHGAEESVIGRLSSNVSPHARQRYSYRGTASVYAPGLRGAGTLSCLATGGEPVGELAGTSSAPAGEWPAGDVEPRPFGLMILDAGPDGALSS